MDQEKTFTLSYQQGKQIQEVLQRYVREELRPRTLVASVYFAGSEQQHSLLRDIEYISTLAALFETEQEN